MKEKILLILIILIVGFLRLYQLGNIPPSPDWDEAALGYNAYLILETGKDEYGKSFPVVLRSFDDYKPALYTYLIIPFIKLNGLNIVSVRLPSAIFGILTVIATYFLVKEFFKRKDLALFSSLLLAISPWHIQFSRVAFETNVGLAFNIFAALFFVKGIKKPWLLTLSAICAVLSIYTYQSEKIFTPLFILLLVIIYQKDLLKLPKKYLAMAIMVGIIAISPMIFYVATNKGSLIRAEATLAFANKTEFLKNNVIRLEADKKRNDVIGTIFDNRRVLYLKTGIEGYLSHYDLNWLFIRGDINRHHAPGMGLLYLWEFPFLFIGIFGLLFNKKWDKRGRIFIFSWFLLAPVPAAFTSGVPHAVRTLNFLPTFQIFTAIGLITAIKFALDIKYKVLGIRFYKILIVGYMVLVVLNFSYYLNQYFVQQNYFVSYDWQYGYETAISEVMKIESKYKRIVVSNDPALDQSYMFFLFYLKFSPASYQNHGNVSAGFRENHKFGKYEFRPIDKNKEQLDRGVLYVGRPTDFSDNVKVIKTINYLNGEPAIKMVERK